MRIQHIILVGAVALLAACGPSGSKQGEEGPVSQVGTEEPALASDQAWVLADQAPLVPNVADTDGPAVQLGTKVKILAREGGFTRVQLEDGAAGWLADANLSAGTRRAVLIQDAAGLPRLTFVGYAPVEGDDSHVAASAAPQEAGGPARSATVARSALSYSRDDLDLAIEWHLAAFEKDPAAKAQRLERAVSKHSSSVFAPFVQDSIESQTGKPAFATEEYSQIATVTADIDVYSAPVDGKVVDHLSQGTGVQTVERTKPDGSNAQWYKLTDPPGWVSADSVKVE